MAQQFADEQPQGFKNWVEKIAIVGAGGNSGRYMAEALVKTGKHKVTALTRPESTSKIPDGVESKILDYEHRASLVEALRGQDVLIITMNVTAPRDQQAKLVEAAAEAKVPWVLPSEWGPDAANKEMSNDMIIGPAKDTTRKLIEQLGQSAWIGIICGFWYEFSIAASPECFGFDVHNRRVILIDDGNVRINTSTWPQIGRGVANLLSSKVLPDDENDKSPCLANFRNKFVYISSFLVNQREMLDSIMRVTGTTIQDWAVEHQQHKERYDSGIKDMKNGDRQGFGRAMYTRGFFPDGCGNYEASRGLHNKILGLETEDIDQYTRIGLDRS